MKLAMGNLGVGYLGPDVCLNQIDEKRKGICGLCMGESALFLRKWPVKYIL
jgi:hypothetical protein